MSEILEQKLKRAFAEGNMELLARTAEKLLAQKPGFIPGLLGLGIALAAKGEVQKAETLFRDILARDAENVDACMHLAGLLARRLGALDEAETNTLRHCANRVLRSAPNHPLMLLHLGMLELRQQKHAEAIPLLERGFTATPPQEKGLWFTFLGQLCDAYLGAKQLENAEKVALQLLPVPPARAAALQALGKVYQLRADASKAEADEQKAISYFEQAVALNPQLGMSWMHLAALYLRGLEVEKAEPAVQKALALLPGVKEAQLLQVDWLSRSKQPRQALEAIDALFARGFVDEALYVLQASSLESLNRIPEAAAALQKVTKPDEHETYFDLLGRVQYRQKLYPEALASFSASLKKEATPAMQSHTLMRLAQTYDKLKRYDEAFESLKQAKAAFQSTAAYQKRDKERAQVWQEYDAHLEWLHGVNVHQWPVYENAPSAKESPVYVVGFPRSGTTLMEEILDVVPGLKGTSESPIYTALLEQMPAILGKDLHYPRGLAELTVEDIQKLRAAYFRIATELGAYTPGTRQIFKMPLSIAKLDLTFVLFPHAPIIVALRDPRDVLLSCLMQLFTFNLAMHNFWSLDHAPEFYAKIMRLYLKFKQILPQQIMVSHYEDLVSNLESQTKVIAAHIDEPWTPEMLRHQEASKTKQITTPSYETVIEPVSTKAIGKWKNYEKHLTPYFKPMQPFIDLWGHKG